MTVLQNLCFLFRELYPEWATLATVACIIPVSSMHIERGFGANLAWAFGAVALKTLFLASNNSPLGAVCHYVIECQ